ncbi:right-handed parallel beta-helix repeat-containing protein [Micromonospora krabiensis]|uniref:Right handed beta helix domain-containing protein n=1 Tax=Micromonospora krabiensis TaxID=307121 RepID=A0A1C3MZR4_9ACTN|nr:right-handed parallel beta-helix repeat-containing protein [Micromonospora krabiensis]SBV25833.1 hypothetical protein GA0070620_1315 [Micromonospora krabiensis]
MSTYQGGRRAARPRRRSRWFLAGGLLAGSLVVGVAGFNGVAATAGDRDFPVLDLAGVLRGDDARPAPGGTAARPNEPSGDGAGRPDGREGDGRDGGGPDRQVGRAEPDRQPADGPGTGRHEVVSVPCDSGKLIAALVQANAEGGGSLRLAAKCTYTLSQAFHQADEYDGGIRDAREAADAAETPGDAEAPKHKPEDDKAGLPVIYQPITVEGDGATIARDVQAEDFRFFTVRDGGELTLRNVTLHNGRSKIEGGAVHVVHGATAVIERTTVTHSTSLSAEGGGGGVFNDGNMVVSDSTFVGNSAAGAAGKGGGLLNGGVLTLRGSRFHQNSANAYGGGLGNYRGAAEVETSTFVRNSAAQGGGLASFSARTKVFDTKVLGNSAQVGGGLANSDAVLVLRKMTIRDNTSTVNGGGISTVKGLLPLDDSVVAGNTTHGAGGGIYADKSNLLVRGSDVTGNEAVGAASKGGGIHALAGQVSVYTSRITWNAATVAPGGVFAHHARARIDDESVIVENEPTNCAGNTPAVAHCFR